MNKYIFLVSAWLIVIGCSSPSHQKTAVLTVTIEPQRFFLEQIVGDKFHVNTLVPPGSSPETYEPSPAAMIKLGNSKAYFKVGFLGYENAWTQKLAKNNPNLQIINCSDGIDIIEEGHGHTHSDNDDHGHSHGADPHVWSSTKNAKQFAQNMLNGVIAVDKENESYYRNNFEQLLIRINEIDEMLSNMLENIPSRAFIIYHPALAYFARDYNLEQHSIEFEGKNPSPSQMKKLIDLSRNENIKVVFVQQEFDIKNTKVIAKEIGATSHTINPLAYEWDEELIRVAQILADPSK